MTRSVSAKALGRSTGTERTLTVLIGLLLLLGGAAVVVVGAGWLGTHRANRPLVDPIALDWLSQHALAARIGAIVLGVLLLWLGLWWFFRSLRPEGRPDLELDEDLVVTSSAISEAVRVDAETVDGVGRARVRAVGDKENPALRITLWLSEGTDLKRVWEQLDSTVLARARESLGVDVLPTAVRIELDTAAPQRVR
ncbi:MULTISPECIES: alkaline shock response membrane anchor protein AmaP [unclassified Amycolatopsis]|uniref:alkaline shock response membrane anchor protein AmaP n=1 Tax=unclassified Amycolatopsis TaxID=2618356 RepID=UPI000F79B877|nr:alkaline shock response membrane anchor protein AmaP [Amycolatopsis sp. WAC 01376]RSM61206.1 alkaline shock response membrane anchor protein AmaP [Amycolatopsis sp. WAC 01376]